METTEFLFGDREKAKEMEKKTENIFKTLLEHTFEAVYSYGYATQG